VGIGGRKREKTVGVGGEKRIFFLGAEMVLVAGRARKWYEYAGERVDLQWREGKGSSYLEGLILIIFEIILEERERMSESDYSLDQEGSEEDYDADEIARPKLRPSNRNK
jgi:hypothetical protein